MNEENYFIFRSSSSRGKSGVSQGDDEWGSNWRKDIQVENDKKIFAWEIHCSEYQLIKDMYKIITSLFLQKLVKAYRNSGGQSN